MSAPLPRPPAFTLRPRAAAAPISALVCRGVAPTRSALPRLYAPSVGGVELSAWAAERRDSLRREVAESGGLLFRGFEIAGRPNFERVVEAVAGPLLEYRERSSARRWLGGRSYTSSDHPSDQTIFLHNESSYAASWPGIIAFFCEMPAEEGGETPLADLRAVATRIGNDLLAEFAERGVSYVRNFGGRLGLDWREVFQTDSRSEVEAYCRAAGLSFEWRPDGRLITRKLGPALRRHPLTRAPVWFNHATFFHISTLLPPVRSALAELPKDMVPANAFYGDGTPISDAAMARVRAAYEAETVAFAWAKGDVLILDNMLTAHGRRPFTGERRVTVAMAEPLSDADCPAVTSADLVAP
jgi:alpha-ketoglutarate-dependent taurine dioxygenase